MENTNTNENALVVTDHLFPLETVVKMVFTKKGGVRYYRGSRMSFRFFPLSKRDFKALDPTTVDVYQEIDGLGWVKIN